MINRTLKHNSLGDYSFTVDETKLLKWLLSAYKPNKKTYSKYCSRGASDKQHELLTDLSRQQITFRYPEGKTVKFSCVSSFIHNAPRQTFEITLDPIFAELLEKSEVRL